MTKPCTGICKARLYNGPKQEIGYVVPLPADDTALLYPAALDGTLQDRAPCVVVGSSAKQYTGCDDMDQRPIFVDEPVEFLGYVGFVTCEGGAFGLAFKDPVDREEMSAHLRAMDIHVDASRFVTNDNFIPLWSIIWELSGDTELAMVPWAHALRHMA